MAEANGLDDLYLQRGLFESDMSLASVSHLLFMLTHGNACMYACVYISTSA